MSDLLQLLSYGATGWGDEILAGAWLTIRLALATLPIGIVLGFLVALMRRSRHAILRGLAEAFSTIFRGIPELLMVFILYFGGQLLMQAVVHLFAPDATIEANGFIAGMLALGLIHAAYASEVFTAAFNAIPTGQWEGGAAIGLHRIQVMRLVILPQLLRLALPALANLWLVLLKDTAYVSAIALNDLLRQTSVAVGTTKQPFFFYTVALFLYLVMSMVSSVGISAIERWSERSQRGRTAGTAVTPVSAESAI